MGKCLPGTDLLIKNLFMILSFNKRFKPLILEGRKVHTIREDKRSRWEPLKPIHFATGARTKEYEQFHVGVCTGVQDFELKYTDARGVVKVYIDGRHFGTWHRFMPQNSVNPEGILQLAVHDGFEGVKEFLNWFKRNFKGKIIHWTELRY